VKELRAQDRAALQVVEGWRLDPRFERVKPVVEKVYQRVRGFVEQAGP
jgi:hypothetical protein